MDQSIVREQNMKRVVKAAQDLFVANGVNNTSISAIAKLVELSETSIYRYFQNKDNIVFAVWKDSLITFYNELIPVYEKKAAELNNGYEKFLCCMQCHIDLYRENPRWLIYTREMFSNVETMPHRKNDDIDHDQKVDAFWEFYGKEIPLPILKALQEGVEDGSIRNDVNIYEVYQLVFNVYTGHNIFQYFSQESAPTDIFSLTVNMLADYLKAEK